MFRSYEMKTAAACAVTLVMALGCTPKEMPRIHHSGDHTFRVNGDYFEINRGDGWESFYPRGVNLGVATPGKFPSDLHHDVETYHAWLQDMSEMNANVVRLYTLHNPAFYQALGEWNDAHPDKPIYLIQGIWLDEPEEEGDSAYYMSDEATRQMDEEIRYVIDAVHGNVNIPPRLGKAYGAYMHDVSDWVMAWLPGHEMLGYEVLLSNEEFPQYTRYDGKYISMADGLPIEGWVARFLDHVVTRELDKYGDQRPLAWSSWPVLDPMIHPTETSVFGQDLVQTDFASFETSGSFTAGLFASYHVYPFNPEFIIYQQDYVATTDATGETNSYFGYLLDLKANHSGVPLMISEFGVPSSMGVAHYNTNAFNHGGYDEDSQAEATAIMYQNIIDSGCAGAVAFAYMDEWFKRTWMTNPTTLPWERARLWYDVISPEQSFGVVSYYPVPGLSIDVDGNREGWTDIGEWIGHQASTNLAGIDDPARTIIDVHVAADPAFLFVRVDTAGADPSAFEDTMFTIALSTVGGETGDRLLPDVGIMTPEGMGAESVVIIDGRNQDFRLATDVPYDPTPRLNGEAPTGAVPKYNDDGLFNLAAFIVNHNLQYKNEAKDVIPEVRYYSPGLLQQGDSRTNNQTHFAMGEDGVLEVRLPWMALWVSDPSSRQVLRDDPDTDGFDTVTTDGARIMVVASRMTDEGPQVVDVFPRTGFANKTFAASEVPLFAWDTWDEAPEVEPRRKPAYFALQEAFGGIHP